MILTLVRTSDILLSIVRKEGDRLTTYEFVMLILAIAGVIIPFVKTKK